MLNLILVEQRIALVSGYLSELEKLAATPRQDSRCTRASATFGAGSSTWRCAACQNR